MLSSGILRKLYKCMHEKAITHIWVYKLNMPVPFSKTKQNSKAALKEEQEK